MLAEYAFLPRPNDRVEGLVATMRDFLANHEAVAALDLSGIELWSGFDPRWEYDRSKGPCPGVDRGCFLTIGDAAALLVRRQLSPVEFTLSVLSGSMRRKDAWTRMRR